MASTIQSSLERLIERTNQLKTRLVDNNIYPTEQQWDVLLSQTTRLTESVTKLQQDMETLKTKRKTQAWKESDKLRAHARSVQDELFSSSSSPSSSSSLKGAQGTGQGKHRSLVTFRRNIIVIYEGPKESVFDSEKTKIWKEATRRRCEMLRKDLSPDGVVAWAVSYSPTMWAGGAMAQDVFECLVDDIEPDQVRRWPAAITDTLHKLKDDEPFLRTSVEYERFLNAIDNPHSRLPQVERKRGTKRPRDQQQQQQQQQDHYHHHHHDSHHQKDHYYNHGPIDASANTQHTTTTDEPSSKRHRAVGYMTHPIPSQEMKFYQFSYLRRDRIGGIPEPLRSGIIGSKKWESEGVAGSHFTYCMSLELPALFDADALLKVWISYEEGFKLMNLYGFQDETYDAPSG